MRSCFFSYMGNLLTFILQFTQKSAILGGHHDENSGDGPRFALGCTFDGAGSGRWALSDCPHRLCSVSTVTKSNAPFLPKLILAVSIALLRTLPPISPAKKSIVQPMT